MKWLENYWGLIPILIIATVINLAILAAYQDRYTSKLRNCQKEVEKYRSIIIDALDVEALK